MVHSNPRGCVVRDRGGATRPEPKTPKRAQHDQQARQEGHFPSSGAAREHHVDEWSSVLREARTVAATGAAGKLLAARWTSVAWTRHDGVLRANGARSCREWPLIIGRGLSATRPLRVRHYTIMRRIWKHSRKRSAVQMELGGTSHGTGVDIFSNAGSKLVDLVDRAPSPSPISGRCSSQKCRIRSWNDCRKMIFIRISGQGSFFK